MPRLSIVIATQGPAASLERSLLSVLENRPDDCEVVVVDASGYQDPYHLADEVQFIPTAPQTPLPDAINLGIQASRGWIVHTLACGSEVNRGWCEPVFPHFVDPQTASVAPLALDLQQPERVFAAGLAPYVGGKAARRGARQRLTADLLRAAEVFGCSLVAGFHRRDIWQRLGGLEPLLGMRYADVDYALRLAAAGLKTVYEPAARVLMPSQTGAATETEFEQGLQAERLFWRNWPQQKGWSTLATHATDALQACLGRAFQGRALPHFCGRLAACFEFGRHAGYHRQLARLTAQATRSVPLDGEPLAGPNPATLRGSTALRRAHSEM